MSSTRSTIVSDTKSMIMEEYRRLTPASAAFHEVATQHLVGGVTGNLRYFDPYPIYFESGDGTTVTDIDGNAYLDCFLCNGPLLLGHRHPAVLDSVREHASTGMLIVNPKLATTVAARLKDVIPCAERVRFVNSGTEAVISALRCARAASGKSKIVKFHGHYHGQFDQLLVGIGRSPRALGHGIPDAAIGATIVLPYGDLDGLTKVLETDPDVGGVILDPVMHSGGLWGSHPDYLTGVRELTRKHGVVLIFDEVITGFRLGLGGAQEYFGVTPDIATFAKALSAGEKIGAVVGRQDIMDVLDPRRARGQAWVYQSGTTNDGTAALAAAIGALDTYRDLAASGAYERLFALSAELADGLRCVFRDRNVPCHINQLGPMLQMYLTDGEPGFEAFSRVDMEPLSLFSLAMLSEGVLYALPGSTHVYLSFCHTEHDIHAIIAAASRVLDQYDFASLVESCC